jgi:hypothetical protein
LKKSALCSRTRRLCGDASPLMKKIFPTQIMQNAELTMSKNLNHLFLSYPEAHPSDSFVSVSQ